MKASPLGNDGLHPRAVVPFTDVVEQVDAKLARTRLGDQKSPGAQVGGQLKRERRIVYADSHCHRSPVRPSVVSLSTNDLSDSQAAERPLRTIVFCYSVWDDEANDEANIGWLRNAMEALEPLAVGHYVAETDLLADPSFPTRSFSATAWERLTRLSERLDPLGVFHPYLGME